MPQMQTHKREGEREGMGMVRKGRMRVGKGLKKDGKELGRRRGSG